jgi:hypothetical protein
MKRISTFAFALGLLTFFGGMAMAQAPAPSPSPNPQPVKPTVVPAPTPAADAVQAPGGGIFQFEEETHDFGDLMQGGDASFIFRFTNTGTEDIIITDVKKQCGCTTPKDWTRTPIAPGGQGEISIAYDSNRIGGFQKGVTIMSNSSEPVKIINIKGNILAKPADPTFTAPAPGPANH